MSDGPLRAMGWALLAATGVALIMLALSIMALGWVITSASAHSWYPGECCSSVDCEPLAPDQVQLTKDGYLLPNGILVRYGEERPSRDYDYHWCRNLSTKQIITPGGRPICFFAPPAGG